MKSCLVTARHRVPSAAAVDARLEEVVRGAVMLGALLVVLLPGARGVSPVLGWLPLWLLAMPLSAWWALHRFRLPWRGAGEHPPVAAMRRMRRQPAQARRRVRAAARPGLAHAA